MMKRILFPILLLSSLAACDSKAQELLCTKAGKVTVHYKNADRVRYSNSLEMWRIVYFDTKGFADGTVHYKQALGESCRILTN